MDARLDKALGEMQKLLDLDIKARPKKLSDLDASFSNRYFSHLKSFAAKLKPRFIKVQAMYQHQGKSVGVTRQDKEAKNEVLGMLKHLKRKPVGIDCFDNFVVRYEDKEGSEEVLNLLRGKAEIEVEVEASGSYKNRELYELIQPQLKSFTDNL
jgi:hypothetical protein